MGRLGSSQEGRRKEVVETESLYWRKEGMGREMGKGIDER